MYKAFKIDIRASSFRNLIYNSSPKRSDIVDRRRLLTQLEEIILLDKINAHEIMNSWFQGVNAQVFLSHSSNDRALVNKFANWLEDEKKIKPFIDSEVWGHIDFLSRALHEKFARKNSNSFDYDKVRIIDSHIHIMLTHALRNMIDKAECFIFLASPSSLDVSEVTENTYSPWIFHELATVDSIIPRCPPRTLSENFSGNESLRIAANSADIFYTPPQNKLFNVTTQNLKRLYTKGDHFLDELYELN